MRITTNKPNTLRLHDNISDSTLELYFRTPTAKEQAKYTNGMTKRIRNKIVNCTGECRQKHGRDILEGWREGDFGEEKDGKVVVISSKSGSSNFRQDWKEWFCKHNADLVERLAIHAFEQTADTDDSEDLPGEEQEDSDPN
ncbi:hypothetical protein [Desulfobacula phenolica]|uniref:Uncharacterized protein n=1 Tax=Desulfobacula phenolica TaxID=90732 RepID=A0A1H2H480_9BACT|nr:hypothetical protein [Desulfobacula phenolica]SDU26644.1 hypothetical protein SAMN04487931_10638 [Desulfobacula phenolica]